jgi:Helix-turn-helix domain
MKPNCVVEGCNRPHHARGLCKMHYGRKLYHREDFPEFKPRRAISPEERVNIYTRRLAGESVADIAAALKLNRTTIFCIIKGLIPKKPLLSGCLIPGCKKTHRARGYCTSHYYRLHKYGDPLISAPRKLMTPEQKEIIRGMRAAGIYITTIAKELNFNKTTISRTLNKLEQGTC